MASPGPLKNLYYQRAVGTPKPCYICRRQTTIVLATADTSDFLYTCATHLTDPGFATPITPVPLIPTFPSPAGTGSPKPKLSDAEIKKIAEEWEEKQRLKKEKEKTNGDEKDKGQEKNDGAQGKGKSTTSQPPSSSPTPTPTPAQSSPAAPSHLQFALHRQIFAMRQAEQRRRQAAAQVKQFTPKLPNVPTESA